MIRTYLFTGFIESGKTSFLQDTLMDPDFCENEKTLLIVLEEGIEVYNEDALKNNNVDVVYKDSTISSSELEELNNKYQPTQVMIEFNGMSSVEDFINKTCIKEWQVVQVLTTHNAKTFEMYYSNMRSIMVDQSKFSDLIIINRCNKDTKKYAIRSAMLSINNKCQIIFENEDRQIEPITSDDLPFNINDSYLDIADYDFGIFCLDLMDHPETYQDKTIKIKGQFKGKDRYIENGFVLGRQAMVCCEQDMQLIGVVCISEYASKLIPDEWLDVEGTINVVYDEQEGYNIPILHIDKLASCQPLENEIVNFN